LGPILFVNANRYEAHEIWSLRDAADEIHGELIAMAEEVTA
jgi:hypothetical protein